MILALMVLSLCTASIVQLSENNFTAFLEEKFNEHKNIIIKVFLQTCIHCIKFAPIYRDAEYISSKDADSNVIFAEFDASTSKVFSEIYHISAYPTVLIFDTISKEPKPYTDSLDVFTIINYLRWVAIKGPLKLESDEELTQRMANLDFTFELHVGTTAKPISSFRVYEMEKSATIEAGIYLVRDIFTAYPKERITKVEGSDDIKKIMSQSVGFCNEISSFYKSNEATVTLLMSVDKLRNAPYLRYTTNRLRMLKTKFPTLNFCIQHADTSLPYIANTYNRTQAATLSIKQGKLKYRMMEDAMSFSTFNMAKSVEFLTNYLKGNVEPWIWSQPLPELNDEYDVKEIVGRNFKEFIRNNKSHVIMRIYNELKDNPDQKSEWYKLYDLISNKKLNVVMGQLERVFNELPEEYYNLLRKGDTFLYLKNTTDPIMFSWRKNTTAESLLKFLEENIK